MGFDVLCEGPGGQSLTRLREGNESARRPGELSGFGRILGRIRNFSMFTRVGSRFEPEGRGFESLPACLSHDVGRFCAQTLGLGLGGAFRLRALPTEGGRRERLASDEYDGMTIQRMVSSESPVRIWSRARDKAKRLQDETSEDRNSKRLNL